MAATVTLILVGSELVRGSLADENRQFVAEELQAAGLDLVSVHVVKDDASSLAALIRHLASETTYVITVGGLGPTLDDVTLEAVALALGLPPVRNEPTDAASFARMSGSETVQSSLRVVPKDAELILTSHGPVVRSANVFSLPGLPRLVRARWPAALARLRRGAIHSRAMSFRGPQSQLAGILNEAALLFPTVSIGCYPTSEAKTTKITIQNGKEYRVQDCLDYVIAKAVANGVYPE